MRTAAVLVSLLVLSPALAQDDAPAQPAELPTRVELALMSLVDDAAETPNTLQYFFWERFTKFGYRADAVNPVNHAKLDAYITKRAEGWAEKDGESPQPATFRIEGEAVCNYDSAEFFGQGQAHNYKGRINVNLLDAATGETIAQFQLEHSWGRLPANYTKRKTLEEYNTMVFGAVLLGILKHERVQATIPASKRPTVDRFMQDMKERILGPLEESMSECEVAVYLRELFPAPPADATPDQAPADSPSPRAD